MGRKRKRGPSGQWSNTPKRSTKAHPGPQQYHPVLSAYFPRLLLLRDYLLSRLPASSKIRRRRLARLSPPVAAGDGDGQAADLLDSIIVAVNEPSSSHFDVGPEEPWPRSQQQEHSTTLLGRTGLGAERYSQSEVCIAQAREERSPKKTTGLKNGLDCGFGRRLPLP